MTRRRAPVVLVATLLLVGGPGRAAPPLVETTPEVEAARGHFRSGSAWYSEGKYDKAIAEFEAAWELAPLPDILFNLGQAHRLAGDKRAAIRAYRRYLGTSPRGPAALAARRHLDELEADLLREEREREERLAAEAQKEAEERRLRQERQEREERRLREERERAAAEAAARAATPVPVPAPAPAPPLYRRVWPWALAGGVVVAGAAVGLGVALAPGAQAPAADTDLGTFKPF